MSEVVGLSVKIVSNRTKPGKLDTIHIFSKECSAWRFNVEQHFLLISSMMVLQELTASNKLLSFTLTTGFTTINANSVLDKGCHCLLFFCFESAPSTAMMQVPSIRERALLKSSNCSTPKARSSVLCLIGNKLSTSSCSVFK